MRPTDVLSNQSRATLYAAMTSKTITDTLGFTFSHMLTDIPQQTTDTQTTERVNLTGTGLTLSQSYRYRQCMFRNSAEPHCSMTPATLPD